MANTNTERTVFVPRVTLGGTHPNVLLLYRSNFSAAVNKAMVSLGAMSPHPHDYPDDDAYATAVRQQQRRWKIFQDLRADIEIEQESILEQSGL